jgi:arylformamidase
LPGQHRLNDSLTRAYPGPAWTDISVPLKTGMAHWPSDPPVSIERIMDVARGDSHTLSQISMGSHAGTHIDAPLHFNVNGTTIDRMPLDIAVGEARVIEVSDKESVKKENLFPYDIKPGERILIKTQNSPGAWQAGEFIEDFVYLSRDAAAFLGERKIRLLGVDYLSVGGYKKNGGDTHRLLLNAGVWIIEGLDLSAIGPGRYELVCLPLRIFNGDGAPARAIVRIIPKEGE